MNLSHRLKPVHMHLMVKIAETGQLQLAADALAMSQPAASRILSMVEQETQGALFTRGPTGMALTERGAAFLRHAKAVLADYEALEAEVLSFNTGQSGTIRVGSVTGPAVDCLVPAIRAVKSTAADLNITVDIGPSTHLLRGLEEGQLDFIIARLPSGHDASELRLHPARLETVSLVVHKTHPLARAHQVTLADILDNEWIIQEPGSPIRDAVDDSFRAHNLPSPQNVTNSSSLLIALSMLAADHVIAPLTEQVANLFVSDRLGADLAVLDLDHQIEVRPFFVIHNRYRQLTRATEILLKETLGRL